MLVLLVAVGQMAQTIYIPAIADMAVALNVREGGVGGTKRDGGYLLTYGISQLFYGPLSDRASPPGDPRRDVDFYAGDAQLLPPIACRADLPPAPCRGWAPGSAA